METMDKTSRRKSHLLKRNKMDCGPKYSKVSESLRYATSGSVQCSMFCGGRQCKYEGPAKWSDNEMVIKGLYSSWVTENILAMARPSTRIVKKYNIIQQFQRWGITAIINLQHPGEHANCGFGLEKSGFSYNPEDFMDNGIFFYNFIWKDYGVCSLETVLDIVKVMDFALQEGKVSVHCHAGLGRTGVLICCYLIYSLRMAPEQAIHTVRRKRLLNHASRSISCFINRGRLAHEVYETANRLRGKAVQTRGQISCVQDFSKFLKPLRVIFPSCYAVGVKQFTLEKYLVHQRHMLHGYEARELKYIPKIIFASCKRLLDICKMDSTRLKLTESRLMDRQDEDVDKEDGGVKNILNYDSQPTTMISASMEDLKGEYDDIPENGVCQDDMDHFLSNSQPSGLPSLYQKPVSLPIPRRKSDSALCELHRKKVELELEGEQQSSNTNNDDFELPIVQQIKPANKTQSSRETNSTNDEDSNEDQQKRTEMVAEAFAASEGQDENDVMLNVQTLQRVLNESNEGWDALEEETDARVLTSLIFSWITTLQGPVLNERYVENLEESDNPRENLLTLSRAQRGICECLFTTIFKLKDISKELRDKALLNVINILTQRPRNKNTSNQSDMDEDITETNGKEHKSTALSNAQSLTCNCLKYLTSLYEIFAKDDR